MGRYVYTENEHSENKEQIKTGQVWGHTLEQRVAVSTLRRYFFGLRLPIARPGRRQSRLARILQIGLHLRNHEACGRSLGMVQPLESRQERI